MRKFRFIGDPNDYVWDQNPEYGRIYTINELDRIRGGEELHYDDLTLPNSDLSEDFEEVFEESKVRTVTVNENQRIGFEETYPTSSGRFLTKDDILPNTKQCHKDTDLGYFAGLAMQGLTACGAVDSVENIAEYSIELAKELIKQLDEETK